LVSVVSFVVKRQLSRVERHDRHAADTCVAALFYFALTIVFTWPLARGLARDIPGDFGDPLLNSWIVSWGATHLGRGWWNANIYHPHPLALAYSEQLLPQALQILPFFALTRNPILCYNLLFLSTFVLSALGMFLFAREITGSREAAFVGGVAYAFAPYRVTSIPHLQVLSAAWAPFALYAFRRYFDLQQLAFTTRDVSDTTDQSSSTEPSCPSCPLWLTIGVLAWIAQNLSCGYYLFFFSPMIAAYLVWEISMRSLWRNPRVVLAIGGACASAAAVTVVVMFPYLELRRLGFNPRSLDETARFSADVYAYLTADPNLRAWGPRLHLWPHPEGALFPGLTIVLLAAVSVWASLRALRFLRWPLFGMSGSGLIIVALLLGWSVRLPGVKIAGLPRALAVVGVLCAVVLIGSRRVRAALRAFLGAPAGFFALVALFAIVMSWGPSIHARGRDVAPANLYSFFYAFVPGFDGLRAPARFAMVASFALAALAALGVAPVARNRRSVPALASMLILIESFAAPIPLNQNSIEYVQPGLAPLPASVWPVPEVYRGVATLPADAAIIELPLGEPAFDVRYVFYSTTHWRPLVNGYSGGAPAEYEQLDQRLRDALTRPEVAWQALVDAKPTHAVVHEALYADDRGRRISEWLRSYGARETANFGRDRIFQIPTGVKPDTPH
jgi:hypothetical protein